MEKSIKIVKSLEETIDFVNSVRTLLFLAYGKIGVLNRDREKEIREKRDFIDELENKELPELENEELTELENKELNKELTELRQQRIAQMKNSIAYMKNSEEQLIKEMMEDIQSFELAYEKIQPYLWELQAAIAEHELNSNEN